MYLFPLIINLYFLQCFFSSYSHVINNVENLLFLIFVVVFINLSKFTFTEVNLIISDVKFNLRLNSIYMCTLYLLLAHQCENYLLKILNNFGIVTYIIAKTQSIFVSINQVSKFTYFYNYLYSNYINSIIKIYYKLLYQYLKLSFGASIIAFKINRDFLTFLGN